MNQTKEKAYKNALIGNQLLRLNFKEKSEIINELLKTRTQRELAKELGVSQTTIFDMKSRRKEGRPNTNVNLNSIYRHLKELEVNKIKDWGRLEMIKELVEELLKHKRK